MEENEDNMVKIGLLEMFDNIVKLCFLFINMMKRW